MAWSRALACPERRRASRHHVHAFAGSEGRRQRGLRGALWSAGANHASFAPRGPGPQMTVQPIASERDRYVVATKYSAFIRAGDPNAGGSHRKSLIQALESSLSRLNTDYIDLYWVHVWDPLTPVDELMRVLDDQVGAGKVLHVGISDTPAWVVARANTLADLRGWSPFAGIQVEYSLIERAVERELVPMAHSLDLAVLGWAPLGRGLLTGKYTTE